MRCAGTAHRVLGSDLLSRSFVAPHPAPAIRHARIATRQLALGPYPPRARPGRSGPVLQDSADRNRREPIDAKHRPDPLAFPWIMWAQLSGLDDKRDWPLDQLEFARD